MRYQLVKNDNSIVRADTVNRIDDSGVISSIPADPGNTDWQIYQEWLSEGNSPEAPDSVTASPSGGEPTTASDAPTDGNPSP